MQGQTRELEKLLQGLAPVTIAFSGGVDSTFLAAVAARALAREQVEAVTVDLAFVPSRLTEAAVSVAGDLGLRHRVLSVDILASPPVCANPPDRCYHCKTRILGAVREALTDGDRITLVDGTNADDLGTVRPGKRALDELGVRSPLAECGFTKAMIRDESRRLGLPTADMPAFSCLATRIPFGETITRERLERVDAVEEYLWRAGVRNCRARDHGRIVRVEVDPADIPRLVSPVLREGLVRAGRQAGYERVTLDLEGYRRNDPP
jgi:uncharacterized protein